MKAYFRKLTLFLLAGVCLLSSCIKDRIENCPDYTTRVKVVVTNLPDTETPNDSEINSIDLYVFNTEGELIEKREDILLNNWVGLTYPNAGKLQLIAVANTANENVIVTNTEDNSHITTSSITLTSSYEFDSKLLYHAPGDIFLGNIIVENNELISEEKELPISRIVSRINVKVKGHKEYATLVLGLPVLPADDEFTFVVETKHFSVDFLENRCNTPVHYYTKNILSSADMCEVSTFNMFSSLEGENVIVHIYHNDTLIDTISEAISEAEGNTTSSLISYSGKLLEVFINYQAGLTVVLQNTNWWEGEWLWKDF